MGLFCSVTYCSEMIAGPLESVAMIVIATSILYRRLDGRGQVDFPPEPDLHRRYGRHRWGLIPSRNRRHPGPPLTPGTKPA